MATTAQLLRLISVSSSRVVFTQIKYIIKLTRPVLCSYLAGHQLGQVDMVILAFHFSKQRLFWMYVRSFFSSPSESAFELRNGMEVYRLRSQPMRLVSDKSADPDVATAAWRNFQRSTNQVPAQSSAAHLRLSVRNFISNDVLHLTRIVV